MDHEERMQADILALLGLFRGRVPDPETLAWTVELAAERDEWENGRDLFDRVRSRTLEAIESGDHVRECQHRFEETCLQGFADETHHPGPFFSCSPYWVLRNALVLARAVGVPTREVVTVVAPSCSPVAFAETPARP